MSIFKEVSLIWKGEEYIVSPDNVMGLIEVIEDVITLDELHSGSGIKRSKISKAFATALRYAAQNSKPRKSCNVTQQDIYESLFSVEEGGQISSIINTLLFMMVPPKHLQDNSQDAKEEAEMSKAVKSANEQITSESDS